MQLEGEITHITFHNEVNGYTIATLSHNHERTTVVGRFFSIKPGESVKLQGEFVTNKTYGHQFSFTSYAIISPHISILSMLLSTLLYFAIIIIFNKCYRLHDGYGLFFIIFMKIFTLFFCCSG